MQTKNGQAKKSSEFQIPNYGTATKYQLKNKTFDFYWLDGASH